MRCLYDEAIRISKLADHCRTGTADTVEGRKRKAGACPELTVRE
jgi:hypothetical protein